MKAIILAAGRGKRMRGRTESLPKCLLHLSGQSLLEWQLEAIRSAGIKEIGIVRGYQKEKLAFADLQTFDNPRWHETHMVSSLCCASEWLGSDTCLVSYSDIVYNADTVARLLRADGDIVIAYDPQWLHLWKARFENPLEDAETFRVDVNGRVLEIGAKTGRLEDIQGQYMGLLKFNPKGWANILSYLASLSPKEIDRLDMTSLLDRFLRKNFLIHAVPIQHRWYEVDTENDLRVYESLISQRAGEMWK